MEACQTEHYGLRYEALKWKYFPENFGIGIGGPRDFRGVCRIAATGGPIGKAKLGSSRTRDPDNFNQV
eukprot:scaffold65329_cov77-Cyclotella_meneghiniana.AAC.9